MPNNSKSDTFEKWFARLRKLLDDAQEMMQRKPPPPSDIPHPIAMRGTVKAAAKKK